MNSKKLKRIKVLLCFAHPDDMVLSCGGTVAKLCLEDYEVKVLEVTNGSQSNNLSAKHRTGESEESARLLGYELDQLSFPDGKVQYDMFLIAEIEKRMAEFRPQIVITHFPQALGRGHQDHQAVSSSVLNCARRLPFVKYVLYSEPVSSFDDFTPNLFIDITKEFGLKLQSINLHKSESHKYYVAENSIKTRARFWRELAEPTASKPEEYYEAFCLVKGRPNVFLN